MSTLADDVPAFRVTTREIAPATSLLPLLDARHPLVFVRRGEGVAGLGEALRLEFSGPDRFREAAAAWKRIAAAASIEDPIRRSGSGLVAFGAFAFDDASARASVLIVPRVVIGRRDGVTWTTTIETPGEPLVEPRLAAAPLGDEYRIALHPGRLDGEGYRAAVGAAVERIEAGEVRKVVVARDLEGRLPEGGDLRRVLMELALGYPDTWSFAVDGLIGSSPETLVRVKGGQVSARVLAGSIARGSDAEADHAAAVALATSTKDLDEHRFAVRSVLQALEPHARTLAGSEIPFTLKLPNLWHLASDVEGTLGDGSTALDLVGELHPTAAVAGTPTDAALTLIHELEPFDRQRYGGAVGWVDAAGDGKWAIALRSAEVAEDGRITAFAGAGIVAGSDPDQELAETKLKFRPVVEAFG
ncbi:isochorismate synthase [Homoserinibacter sp. YIM 151385]|uniref:isochorismate synthase n=1 Tax=Homoserinibacter sp. YIM 151385 TaxID=2985506 RepID=UPI0022F050E4|nr:isochorismate synthase [Homoserinibacter sp. YIM 151385]WBU36989.1 isochorismate synthase [Homoserinibacter sp. YIM 151385]